MKEILFFIVLLVFQLNAVAQVLDAAKLESGDIFEQIKAGDYYLGIKSKYNHWTRDYQESHDNCIKWYTKAYENNSFVAAVKLGLMYFTFKSDGIKSNSILVQAVRRYSNLTNADRQYLNQNFDIKQEQLLAAAYYGLGWCNCGEKAAKNYSVAVDYFSKSADLGNANAAEMAGLLYCLGYGTAQNYYQGADYFTKSGTARSKYILGVLYYLGKGVSRDKNKAYNLWRESTETAAEHLVRSWRNGDIHVDNSTYKAYITNAFFIHEGLDNDYVRAELQKLMPFSYRFQRD